MDLLTVNSFYHSAIFEGSPGTIFTKGDHLHDTLGKILMDKFHVVDFSGRFLHVERKVAKTCKCGSNRSKVRIIGSSIVRLKHEVVQFFLPPTSCVFLLVFLGLLLLFVLFFEIRVFFVIAFLDFLLLILGLFFFLVMFYTLFGTL